MKVFEQLFRACALLVSGAALFSAEAASLSVTEAGDGLVLSWPVSPAGFRLESVNSLNGKPEWEAVDDLAVISGNFYQVPLPFSGVSRYFRLGPAPLTTIRDSSPANGEIGVSVLRETIVRFTAPLAEGSVISTEQFYAGTSERRLLTRVELASDRRSASLFFLEPMPGGAEVTAVFDGTGMLDESGRPVDPDGDGRPGGKKPIRFQTFNTTPLANTAVIGHVYASVPVAGGGGATANHPLANVTITVDGQEQNLRTTTDSQGAFTLSPCPVGRFFVKIDGRTANESQYPNGAYYPFVGKPWEAVAGKTNNLAGGSGDIFLPLIAKGTLQPVSPLTNTVVTFPATVLATNPALAGVSVTIPANSLFGNDGTRGGKVGIAPVSPDRLPAPLPPGVHPPLVITIQTDGANNLDKPAPVRFPNLPDKVTGKTLPPGAKTALWGFNHKSGRWEIQGPGTISADGKFIDSDPGFGVRQPGWEFFDPSNNGSGGGGGPQIPDPRKPDPNNPSDPSDPCKTERKALESNSIQCVAGTAIGLLATAAQATPGLGCAISAMQGVIGAVADCNIDPSGCKVTIAQNLLNTAIGCVPVLGAGLGTASTVLGAVKSCVLDESIAYGNFLNCKKANGLGAAGHKIHASGLGLAIPDNIWEEQLALLRAVADIETIFLGNVGWTEVEPADVDILVNFYTALQAAMMPGSEGSARITVAERAAVLAMPRPSNITAIGASKLVDRMDQMAAGTLPDSELDLDALLNAALEVQAIIETLMGRGWTTAYDAFTRGLTQPFKEEDKAQSNQPQSTKPMAYRLVDLSGSGATQYGHLNLIGQIDNLILAANDLYRLDYADTDTFYVGHTIFQATSAGQSTLIPKAAMGPANPLDSDGDGLPDEVEIALGTNPNLADSDGDGVPDGVEVASGSDPLVAAPTPLGIVGSVPNQTEMRQIAVSGPIAMVAQGNGVGIYSLNGAQPSSVSTFTLGGAVTSVAFSGNLGLATMDQTGVAVIDVSNPSAPQLARFVGINTTGYSLIKVVAAGNLAYALSGDTLYLLDIAQGLLLDQRHIDAQSEHGQPQDLAVSGGYLYLLTGHTRTFPGDNPGIHRLRKIRVDRIIGADVAVLDIAGTSYAADVPTQIAAVPGFVYLTGLNGSATPRSSGLAIISDGASGLQMVAPPTPLGALCLAANGSGTVIVGGTNLMVLDVRQPAAGGIMATNFALPAPARSVAVGFGRAYVADGFNGMKVVNYYAPDTFGKAPSIALSANFSLNPPLAGPGRSAVVSVSTLDDTQVRAVEFYLNGDLVGLSGSSPFDFWFATPAANHSQFILRARAIDTGGNATWSDTFTVLVDESAAPPSVVQTSPAAKSVNPPGAGAVLAVFDKPLDPASATPSSLRLVSAGPDGVLDTADDAPLAGDIAYGGNPAALSFTPSTGFAVGEYRATLGTDIADTKGNHLASSYSWRFAIKEPVRWTTNKAGFWFDGKNWSKGSVPPSGAFVVAAQTDPLDLITLQGTATLDSLLGTQPMLVTGGVLTLARQSSVGGDFNLQGGTLNVTEGFDIGGLLTWGSATLDGGGVVTANGIDIATGSPHIGKITLVNRGHALWHQPINTGIGIDDPTTTIENAAGGVFETQGRAIVFAGGFSAPFAQFNNKGLFRVFSGANLATIFQGVNFNNTGVVEIETGALELAGPGGKSSGEFRMAADGTLSFKGDNQTTPESLVHGPGRMRASSGTVVLNGPYDVTGATIVEDNARVIINGEARNTGPIFVNGNFGSARLTFSSTPLSIAVPVVLNGGALYLNSFDGKIELPSLTATNLGYLIGTADVSVNGPLLATGCVMFGPGRLVAKGDSTIGNVLLYQANNNTQPRPIDNAGHMSLVGDIEVGPTQVRNLAGATFECAGDHRLSGAQSGPIASFVNSGTVLKPTGNGSFQVDGPFHNSGLVVSGSGKITSSSGYLQTGGETRLAGGNFGGFANYEMNGGLVTGTGIFDLYQFNNNGAVVTPGLPEAPAGSFHFTYSYNQGPGGTLGLDIASAAPNGFDQITADGPCSLGGVLKITVNPGYQPVLGDSFRILECSQRTGKFATVTGTALGNNLKLSALYDNTGVTLKVVAGP